MDLEFRRLLAEVNSVIHRCTCRHANHFATVEMRPGAVSAGESSSGWGGLEFVPAQPVADRVVEELFAPQQACIRLRRAVESEPTAGLPTPATRSGE